MIVGVSLLQRVCTGTLCVRAVHALFVKWAKRNVGGTDTQCLTYRAPLRSLQQRHWKLGLSQYSAKIGFFIKKKQDLIFFL